MADPANMCSFDTTRKGKKWILLLSPQQYNSYGLKAQMHQAQLGQYPEMRCWREMCLLSNSGGTLTFLNMPDNGSVKECVCLIYNNPLQDCCFGKVDKIFLSSHPHNSAGKSRTLTPDESTSQDIWHATGQVQQFWRATSKIAVWKT